MALPPAFSIFSWAALENLCAWTVMGFVSSPLPRILSRPFFFLIRPFFSKYSSVSSVSPSSTRRSRFSVLYSTRKILVKPRLGRRRCSGIWPPSKPRIRLEPEREPCPLCPRVEVLPCPEPIPRPTRFLFLFAFFGALRLERFIFSSLYASQDCPDRLAFTWFPVVSS